jgi:hypothetical protein
LARMQDHQRTKQAAAPNRRPVEPTAPRLDSNQERAA